MSVSDKNPMTDQEQRAYAIAAYIASNLALEGFIDMTPVRDRQGEHDVIIRIIAAILRDMNAVPGEPTGIRHDF